MTTGGTLAVGTYAVSGTDVRYRVEHGHVGVHTHCDHRSVRSLNGHGDDDNVGGFHQPTGDNRQRGRRHLFETTSANSTHVLVSPGV